MRKLFFTTFVFLIALFLLFPGVSLAISIAATGGWSETIDKDDLVSGAGSDLKSSYESASGATLLTISGCTGDTDTWKVRVSRTDYNWHSNFVLYVRRGEDDYQAITTTDSDFFSGAGDTANIALQYKLTGMSVQIPPATYSTTITYTVVDTE
ncbi:MAG: hypothetical protein PWP57_1024 [Candidatus Atribacteria bacterium]|nr:hypothetical protein [Candidatus Atribacteria bacterium]